MTKDEALRLALEAIEICAVRQEHQWYGLQLVSKARAAIKQALEQPEPEPVVSDSNKILLVRSEDGKPKLWNVRYDRPPMTGDRASDVCVLAVMPQTPPPKREPLTNFEDWYQNAIWGNEDFKQGCQRSWDAAIEAAHGIKGEA